MMTEARYYLGRRDREEYAEACSRIRVLEKRLLNQARLTELAAAPDLKEALLILRRWRCIGGHPSTNTADWDRTLTLALKESDRELLAMDPRPLVTALLTVKYDLLNLSAVLRERGSGRAFEGPLHPRGTSSRSLLEKMAAGMDFSSCPTILAGELKERREDLASRDGRQVADAVAQAHHNSLKKAAKLQGSRLLSDYLEHLADLENIKMTLRALTFPQLWGGKGSLFPGGHLAPELLLLPRSAVEFGEALKKTVYYPLIEECRRDDGGISLRTLEIACDDFAGSIMEPARFVSLGPEPLWGYWLAREKDAKNIRTVLVGLRDGTGRKEFQEAFRKPYV